MAERHKKHIENGKDLHLEAEILKQLQVAAPCGEGLAQFVFSLQERFPHNRRNNSQFWTETMFWMRKAWHEAKDGIIWVVMLSLEVVLYGAIMVLAYYSFIAVSTTLVRLMPASGAEIWICMQALLVIFTIMAVTRAIPALIRTLTGRTQSSQQ